MTSKQNMMTVLTYGIIWDFLTVPDSVGTRPFIVPHSSNTESFSHLSIAVSEKTDTMKESGFPDVKPVHSESFQIPEISLEISGKTLIPYDTVEKKGNKFFIPWGNSGINCPESLILHPGENSNMLLFRIYSYFFREALETGIPVIS